MKERTCKRCGRVDNINNYFLAENVELKGDLCERCKKRKEDRKYYIETTLEVGFSIIVGLAIPFLLIYTWISLVMMNGIPHEIVMKVISIMYSITSSQPVIIVSVAYFILIAIIIAIIAIICRIISWVIAVNDWL